MIHRKVSYLTQRGRKPRASEETAGTILNK